ncbi:MAG: YbhB/YbcL family Raf kinase inhibitor-like protein [Acidimicrobiia bacterium]|jgi:Raf kinase inhibitor-like YbhB/YbcL family protein
MRRLLIIAVALSTVSCSSAGDPTTTTLDTTTTTMAEPSTSTSTTVPPPFGVTSPAFVDGAEIPTQFTCDGADISPELNIVGIPEETQSLVIIADDPDAPLGTWDHWVEYDIPSEAGSRDIASGAADLGLAGVNSWKLEGYMGPCPPQGEQHTYHFRVYALGGFLDLPPGVDSEAVRTAMTDLLVDDVELTGVYAR